MSRARNYCFTAFALLDWESIKCDYIIIGHEKCPKTGKIHYQGYVEFENGITLKNAKARFGDDTVHFEQRKGNQKQAIEYCQKDGDFEEYGKKKKQGDRNDLTRIIDYIEDGKTDSEILRTGKVSLQGGKSLDYFRLKLVEERTEKPKVIWLYGETGSGKSHKANEICDGFYDDVSFFNDFIIGYTGRDNVVFQDFRGTMPLNLLLKLTDKWKCTINIKGGSCNWNPKLIVFTSPYRPEKVYKNCDENIKQLLRRIDETVKIECETQHTEVGEGNTMPPPISDLIDSDLSEDEHDE